MEELSNLEILQRVVISLLAGTAIGLEREWNNKPAGIRTYALVSEGAALFMILSLMLSQEVRASGGISDPSRIASTVVQGVGFIAGGVIFTHRAKVVGLTTAAGMWVAAAVGLVIGAGYYMAALIGVLGTLFTLLPMRWFEKELIQKNGKGQEPQTPGEITGGANHE